MSSKAFIYIKGHNSGDVGNVERVTFGNQTNTWLKFTAADGVSTLFGNPHNNLIIEDHSANAIEGGIDPTTKIMKCHFDRASISVEGLVFKMVVTIYLSPENGDPNIIVGRFAHSLINGTATKPRQDLELDTTTSEGLAKYFCWQVKHGLWVDEVSGNSSTLSNYYFGAYDADKTTLLTFDDNDAGGGSTPFSDGAGFTFYLAPDPTGFSRMCNFTTTFQVQGGLLIKKFENVPAFTTNGVDIVTKDLDFDYPGVRKKIYKVIVTYRAPLRMHSEDQVSNIKPFYALNGSNQLRDTVDGEFENDDWKNFDVTNLPSTEEPLEDGNTPDMRWIRQELKPAGSSTLWNNVYSIALRFRSIDEVYGFEINDISIIYRLKGLK